MTAPRVQKSLSLSLIVGILLVPISALAAVWIADSDAAADTSEPAAVSSPARFVTTEQQQPLTTDADLQAACGAEGMKLVDLESANSITDLQQAALDALRPLCEQHGLALPAAPTPAPIVRTIVTPPPITASAPPVTAPDGEWEDEQDDDEDDEREERDDHEEDQDEDHHDHEDDD